MQTSKSGGGGWGDHVHMDAWKPEADPGHLSQYSSALYFEMGSVADPEAHQVDHSRKPLSSRDPPASAFLGFRLWGHTITPAFSYGCWGPELGSLGLLIQQFP